MNCRLRWRHYRSPWRHYRSQLTFCFLVSFVGTKVLVGMCLFTFLHEPACHDSKQHPLALTSCLSLTAIDKRTGDVIFTKTLHPGRFGPCAQHRGQMTTVECTYFVQLSRNTFYPSRSQVSQHPLLWEFLDWIRLYPDGQPRRQCIWQPS